MICLAATYKINNIKCTNNSKCISKNNNITNTCNCITNSKY